jgi:hypothetical protein
MWFPTRHARRDDAGPGAYQSSCFIVSSPSHVASAPPIFSSAPLCMIIAL